PAAGAKAPPQKAGESPDVQLAASAEPTSDVSDVKWVDLVQSPDDSGGIEVVEEGAVTLDAPSDKDLVKSAEKKAKKPEPKGGAEPPKPTQLASKGGQPTQLASKGSPPTMLAPAEEGEDGIDAVREDPEGGGRGERPKGKESKPAAAAGEEKPAKKPAAPPTQLASKSPPPTMLAPADAVEEMLEAEPAGEAPKK